MPRAYSFQSISLLVNSYVSAIDPPAPPAYSIRLAKKPIDVFCKFQFDSQPKYTEDGVTIYPVYMYLNVNKFNMQLVRDLDSNSIVCIDKPASNPKNGLFRIQFPQPSVAAIQADNNMFWTPDPNDYFRFNIKATGNDPTDASCQYNYIIGVTSADSSGG